MTNAHERDDGDEIWELVCLSEWFTILLRQILSTLIYTIPRRCQGFSADSGVFFAPRTGYVGGASSRIVAIISRETASTLVRSRRCA